MAAAQATGAPNARRMEIRPSVQLVYDDNVFRVSEGFNLSGRPRDDIRVTPSVAGDISLPVGRQTLFLNGQVGYDFFKNNDQLDRERIALAGGAELRAGRACSATVTGRYSRQQTDFANVLATVAIPNATEQRTLDVQGRCAGTVGLTPSFGFTRTLVRNSSELFEPLDVNSTTYQVGLGYQRPSLGVVSLYGTYTDTSFVNRSFLVPGDPDPIEDGVESYSAGISFERQIGTRITGTLSFGHTWVNPKLDQTVSFRGLSYAAGIAIRASDDLRVNIDAARTVDVQNIVVASYSITDFVGMTGSYQLNRLLQLRFGSRWQDRRFQAPPQFADIPGFLGVPNDEIVAADIGFALDVTDRLQLTTSFTQERRDSTIDILDYTNSRLSAGISLQL